jgi:hypothetical protein
MDVSASDVRKYIDQLKSMKWLGLAAHLQRSASASGKKCQIIQVSIITDEEGNPIFWTDPECTGVTPAKNALSWLNSL